MYYYIISTRVGFLLDKPPFGRSLYWCIGITRIINAAILTMVSELWTITGYKYAKMYGVYALKNK